MSNNREKERLKILCETSDGEKLAKEDLKLRGMGNIFGKEQSGFTKYAKEILQYPTIFQMAKEYANVFIQNERHKIFVEKMEYLMYGENCDS